MAIRIPCPLCEKSIVVPPERAGRTIHCPGCDEPLMVHFGKTLTLAPVKAGAGESLAEKYKGLWIALALALLGLVIVWTVWKIFFR